ncbi:MAG: hypothetical protein AAF986_08085 [Pseudomonadota bacterium]
MQYDRLKLFPCVFYLLTAPVFANDVLSVTDVGVDDCSSLLPDPRFALSQIAPELKEKPSYSLMVEAILRHCAALGAMSFSDSPLDGPTRSHGNNDETPAQRSDRLAREARYYFETAMQIDADASNDLLRRLLGGGPKKD